MTSSIITSVIVLIAPVCYAQQSFRDQIASLVLAEQSAINSTVECQGYFDDVVPRAVAVRIFSNYTPNACYNLATIFSLDHYDNATLTTSQEDFISSCDPYWANCTNDYQALGLGYYDSSANYTQTLVEMYLTSAGSTLGDLTLNVFTEEECAEDAANQWSSWSGCNQDEPAADCCELPQSARSFRLEQTTSENAGKCMIAAESSAGVQVTKAGFAAVFAGVIVADVVAVM